MFFDTHTHLNFKSFQNDLDEVIDRAKQAGVLKMIVVGSDLESSVAAIHLAKRYEGLYASIAAHPADAVAQSFDIDSFRNIASHEKVMAIGETGLDYYHLRDQKSEIHPLNADPRIAGDQEELKDRQKNTFMDFLHLAKEVNKPVIIHNREATQDILEILTLPKFQDIKGVIHCFVSSLKSAKKFLELGFLISFTGIVTYTDQYDKVIVETPLEKMMIETDCPLLAPEPYRGTRNEPAYVIEVAKKIAKIKGLSLEEVGKQTTKNAEELFKL